MTLQPLKLDASIFVVFFLLNIPAGFPYRGRRQYFEGGYHSYFKNVHSALLGLLTNLITIVGLHHLFREKDRRQQLGLNDPLILKRAARRQAWRTYRLSRILGSIFTYNKACPRAKDFTSLGLYTIAAIYATFYTIDDFGIKAYQVMTASI